MITVFNDVCKKSQISLKAQKKTKQKKQKKTKQNEKNKKQYEILILRA